MVKKLYRNTEEEKLSGVCKGLSEYMGIDVNIIRVLWIILTLVNMTIGIVVYVICVFLIPELPPYIDADYEEKEQ